MIGLLKALTPPPCLKQGYCQYQNRSAIALSNEVLKTRKHRDSTTFPGKLSHYCIDLLMSFFPSSTQFELSKSQLVVVASFCIACRFLVRLRSIILVIVSRSDKQVINSPLSLFPVKLNQPNSVFVGHVLSAFDSLCSPTLYPLQFLSSAFTHYMLPFCTLISLKI